MLRFARPLLGVTLASAALGVAAFLAGCPQSQIDIDFGDGGTSSANDGQVVPPGCDLTKDPKDSPACIDESIALFVAPSGKDTNAGTKAAPLLTIDAALAKADAQHDRVYACEGTYSENVEVSATATASVFGGFSCADWSDTGRLVKISPSKPGYAISILGVAAPITIGDLELDAPNAQKPGDSSIAAFVGSSPGGVTFLNVAVNAGTGANGADGTLIENMYPTNNAGNSGSGGTGGDAVTVTCASCTTVGGKGGSSGLSGDPGTPRVDGGTGGSGGTLAASCGSAGAVGGDGDPGLAGSNGAGAATAGTIRENGWQPNAGGNGESGGCGQGGGGGAGIGGGGGGGGAGGCGGASGAPGNGGGGSIGVLIFSSPVTISKSVITTSAGGNGGAGVAGQPGQTPGGAHGNGAGSACQGGNGGAGGAGGASGGGAGGVSIGVFYKSSKAPVVDADTKFNGPTSGGTKGAGGAPGVNDGVDGTAGTTIENK